MTMTVTDLINKGVDAGRHIADECSEICRKIGDMVRLGYRPRFKTPVRYGPWTVTVTDDNGSGTVQHDVHTGGSGVGCQYDYKTGRSWPREPQFVFKCVGSPKDCRTLLIALDEYRRMLNKVLAGLERHAEKEVRDGHARLKSKIVEELIMKNGGSP